MTPAPGAGTPLGEAPAPLAPEDSFRQAARAAMWPQVRRLLDVEPALRDPDAVEDLKRYRVATRRLRAALRVFEAALPKRAVGAISPELRDLARAVGRVRDLDVRIGGLVAWAADSGAPAPDVEPVRAAWAAERAAAAADVAHRLETKRHARLLDDLAGLVRQPDSEGDTKGPAVRDRAGSATWAAFERVRSVAAELDAADLEVLHDLRIRAKRLRYTLEFLGPVLGADRDWLVARLVSLQDHLGALHDADLAAAAAQTFLADDASIASEEQRTAIEAYIAAETAAVERLRGTLARVVRPVLADAFARRLSAAVLGPDEPKTPKASPAAKEPGS